MHDNSNSDTFTAIRYAAWKGDTELVKILLQDDRVDPSAQDNEGKDARQYQL